MKAAGIAICAALLAASALAQESCAPDILDIRSDGTQVRFSVELADTVEERAVGLMNRPEMPRFSGMIFAYEAPGTVGFWMKNTLIPLDMLFADQTGTVRRIHANAEPLSTETIPGGTDIQYVLEINGGLAETLGLTEGAELRHPAIDPEHAAWPCED